MGEVKDGIYATYKEQLAKKCEEYYNVCVNQLGAAAHDGKLSTVVSCDSKIISHVVVKMLKDEGIDAALEQSGAGYKIRCALNIPEQEADALVNDLYLKLKRGRINESLF